MLPIILSSEERLEVLGYVGENNHRTILACCYPAGLRISEAPPPYSAACGNVPARRRPNKSRGWLKQEYFGRQRLNQWCFFEKSYDSEGSPQTVWLWLANRTPIK